MRDPKNPWDCLCPPGAQHSPYSFVKLDPSVYARKVGIPPWPETDPVPEVRTLDPIPAGVKKPRSIALLAGEFPEIRIGYNRVLLRGVTLGTYRRVEAWTVWFPPDRSPRPWAEYLRFADKREVLRWNGEAIEPHVDATGEPGDWKWSRVRLGQTETNITKLKEALR